MTRPLYPAVLSLVALAACSDTGVRKFGTSREPAPELRAASPPPLSAPPSLRDQPSRLGAAPEDPALSPETSASAGAGGLSVGQSAIIGAAGPSAPSNIRQRVEQDQQVRNQHAEFTNELLARPPGPSGETPAPIVQPGSKSWLDSIF